MNLKVNSYAKINLALKVGQILPNQLHEVKSVIQTVDLADQIHFESIYDQNTIVKAIGDCPSGEDNLVFKAISKLRQIRSFGGVRATIHKKIPSGAGLGGASSNAAATLKAINNLFELNVDEDQLLSISRGLGSDVPALFVGGCTFVEGTGDIVKQIHSPLKSECIVLVKPRFSISTRDAYKGLEEYSERPENDFNPSSFDLSGCFNDFEPWALNTYRSLVDIKQLAMSSKPLTACLTGSGSVYFTIFRNADDAYGFRSSVLEFDNIESVFIVNPIDRGVDI